MLLATVGTGLGQAPVITNDLQNQTTCIGADATFTVGVTGSEPLAYQWQKTLDSVNCSDLPGCTNATMVITNVQGTDFVYYHVVITNAEGAATKFLGSRGCGCAAGYFSLRPADDLAWGEPGSQRRQPGHR